MEKGDADWERAHLRVEGNGVEEGDTDWERAHLIGWEWCGGERCRLGESALDTVGMSGGGRHRLKKGALDRLGLLWGRKSPTGRGRT